MQGQNSFYSEFNKLKEIEFAPKKDIEEVRLNKLRNLLKHSYRNVFLYNEIYKDVEVDLTHFNNTDDLCKLPILTKDVVRRYFPDGVIAKGLKSRANYNTTSGSTGEPLEFYNDRRAEPYRTASFMFFNTWMGVKPFDRHWNLKSLGKLKLKQKVWYWLTQKNMYSVMDVKKEVVHSIVSEIENLKPSYIEGYTGSLVKLARFIEELGLNINFDVNAIIATSENQIESHRDLMERVFGCRVFNRYGSREFCGAIAQECSDYEGFHVNPLLCFVEIVDENGEWVDEGETGKILITDLNNYAMPFVRYDIGDIGVQGSDETSCGRNFQTIDSIEGREGDFIISTTGEMIPFVTISAFLFRRLYSPYVYNYQFVQEEKGQVRLNVVPTPRFSNEIREKMFNTLRTLLPSFNVELLVVDEIPLGRSGKTPFLKMSF